MSTTFLKTAETLQKDWYVTDASGVPLGRLASQVAKVLMGKHKPAYTPYVDSGDYVVVINAGKIHLTGKKLVQKLDYRHTGYPGGQRFTQYKVMVARFPERTIQLAVKGMLPKTRLGKHMIKKLKVFRGDHHPYDHYGPQPLTVRHNGLANA